MDLANNATFPEGARRTWLWLILAAGFVLRLVYAHNLPPMHDETTHLWLARQLSLSPDSFFIPLSHPSISHPLGALYLAALGQFIGNGSLLATRVLFIVVGMAGVYGVYELTMRFFGVRAALIAAVLAALDRHLMVESTHVLTSVYLAAAPWMLLLFFNAVENNDTKSSMLLGLVSGLAYMVYEPTALFFLAFLLYALSFGHMGRLVRNPNFWIGGALFLCIVAPYLYSDLTSTYPQSAHQFSRAAGIGIAPRVLALFLGDVITPFLDPGWLLLSMGDRMHLPTRVPCQFLAGCLHLICIFWALRHYKEKKYALLLLSIFCIAVPCSMLNKWEPLNNFWWCSGMLFPALALTGQAVSQFADNRFKQFAVMGLFLVLLAADCLFLAGPKHTYTAFSREKRFIAAMLPFEQGDESQRKKQAPEAIQKAQLYTLRHPRSFLGYYYQAAFSQDAHQAKQHLAQALDRSPGNPAILVLAAGMEARAGRWLQAQAYLSKADNLMPDCFAIKKRQAYAALNASMFAQCEFIILQALKIKPVSYDLHRLLCLALMAQGKMEEAQNALAVFIRWQYYHPWEGYRDFAEELAKSGRCDEADAFWRQARKLNAGLPALGPWRSFPEKQITGRTPP